MQRNQQQNRALHLLITQAGLDADTKAEMVLSYTEGCTCSSAEMTLQECNELIRSLRKMIPDVLDKKRKRVIANLAEAGFVKNGKPDMMGINRWVLQQAFKKRLNDHNSEELSKLIYASEQVLKHFLNKIRK